MAQVFDQNQPSSGDQEKIRFIGEITANADAVQDRVLAEILTQNAEADYLERYGLAGATDRATFKAKIPVVTYEDLQPYIDRIADGDQTAVLSGKPVCEFFTSSGTSGGERKLIPVISDDFNRVFSVGSLCEAIVKFKVPGFTKETGKYMDFIVLRSETKTSGGLIARSVSSSVYKLCRGSYWAENTCPAAVVHCQDYFQSMYIQFLCGLYQRLQVLQLGTTFASGLIRSIRFLRDNWPQLVRDIETGTLSDNITDQSLRDSVSDILRPDRELASFLADQCSSEDWSGIVAKIWPNAKCLRTVVTGAMSQYKPMLELYGCGLPIVSMLYASSESYLGINLDPMCDPLEVSYTLLPNLAYFEFMPNEPKEGTARGELVDLAKVELGKKYELVITTYAGLYRYQVGDILQVTGFHNAAPQFKFVGRKGVLLSIDTDKTDEAELQRAVYRASELLKPYGTTVAEYTSNAYTRSTPGHYVIYWELMLGEGGKAIDGEALGNCCLAMEEALNEVYIGRRASGDIGPLEIRVVKGGTFEELMNRAVSNGASVNQYKVPRCVRHPDIVGLLDSRMVSTHFSPAGPRLSIHKSV